MSAEAEPALGGPRVVEPAQPAGAGSRLPAAGDGYFFPQTATGVPLAVFSFGFTVGMLGLFDTNIVTGLASGLFVATAFGVGGLGLLIGGLWEFRANNAFGGTFGVAYGLFVLTTALMLKVFAPAVTAAAGAAGFGHAFGAWMILWGIFTVVMTVGARTVNLPAFVAFALLTAVYFVLGIAAIGGAAGWAASLTKVGGWLALADGLAAWYLGAGILLNGMLGRPVIPLFPHQQAG